MALAPLLVGTRKVGYHRGPAGLHGPGELVQLPDGTRHLLRAADNVAWCEADMTAPASLHPFPGMHWDRVPGGDRLMCVKCDQLLRSGARG